jgi:hypothetical protein
MSPDLVFTICNNAVLPAWLMLAVAPGWIWTQRVVHAIWIPLLLGLVYAWAFTANPPAPEGGGFTSLEGVMKLFTSPYVMLAGWVHYIVFDLFVGAWETRDARRHGIGQPWLVPCLALTLMLGPLGLLAYLVLRWVKTRDTGLDESAGLVGAEAA